MLKKISPGSTLPETNSSHLQNNPTWKFGGSIWETIIFWGELLVGKGSVILEDGPHDSTPTGYVATFQGGMFHQQFLW